VDCPDAADLAPGDAWAATLDSSDLEVHRVESADEPRFAAAYELLWREFGARNEMEQCGVLAERLAWRPSRPVGGCALRYEMLVIERAGEIVAVRDHSAIVPLDDADAPVVVHLSHAFVLPAARRAGLGAWLRGLPLACARACAAAAGAAGRRIVLVAEMEPGEPAHEEGISGRGADAAGSARCEADDAGSARRSADEAGQARLRIYGRAGFRCVSPARVAYRQPDFRPAAAVDASGVHAVPLSLIVRRVGRESETTVPASEVRSVVRALYAMYGAHQREADMVSLWQHFAALPDGDEQIELLVPAP